MNYRVWPLALLVLLHCGGWAASARAGVQEDLVSACGRGDLATARTLVGKGAKANEPDREERLPLLFAVFSKNPDLVALLLEHGADPNRTGYCPETECRGDHPALPLAAYLNQPKLVKLLLHAKADVAWNDHYATRNANVLGFVEVYKLLKAAGGHEWASPPADAPAAPDHARTPAAAPAGLPPPPEPAELLPSAAPLPKAAPKAAGAPLRLAIVADERLEGLAEILTEQLSKQGVSLVERQDLDRVLEEQHLSAAQVTPARGPALGALLGADALVMIDLVGSGAGRTAETRLVRVSPGLVLGRTSEPLPVRNSPEWLKRTGGMLEGGLAMARATRGIAIALAGLRAPSDLPRAQAFAQQAETVLQDELFHQPGLTILERKALDEIARERALGAAGEFWTGSYLADGTAEAPLTEGGPATVTLRLQPMEEKPALIFRAQGPADTVMGLVRDVVRQAAKALALETATSPDSAAEAERQLAQARTALENRLYLQAYRAVEAATFLGLKSAAAREWRLRLGTAVIGSTLRDLTKDLAFTQLTRSGWGEDWVNYRLHGRPWLRPPESLTVARRDLELWHSFMHEAMVAGDHAEADRWMQYGRKYVIPTALALWGSLHTVAGQEAYPEEMEAIPRTLKDSLEGLSAAAGDAPEWSALTADLNQLLQQNLRTFVRDTDALAAEISHRLEANADESHLADRLKALLVIMHMSKQESGYYSVDDPSEKAPSQSYEIFTPWASPLPAKMRAWLEKSTRPEDRLFCQFMQCLWVDLPQKAAASEVLLRMVWDERDLFVREPYALYLFVAIDDELRRYWNFPLWRISSPHGEFVRSPEMFDLRRKLFLHVMSKSQKDISPARVVMDPKYHPPGENLAEMEKFEARIAAAATPSPAPPATTPRATPSARKALPLPASPPVPSFAQEEPLRMPIAWTAEKEIPNKSDDFALDLRSLTAEGDRLWAFAQGQRDSPPGDSCLVEIELPSFATRLWPFPAGAVKTHSAASLMVDADRIAITKDEEFYGEWDRHTHQWKFYRDMQPFSAAVREGNNAYFLTGRPGETGLVQFDSATGAATLLASSRRIPAVSPLDSPRVLPRSLSIAAGRLFIHISESKDPAQTVGEVLDSSNGKERIIIYDVRKGTWTDFSDAVRDPAGPIRMPGPDAAIAYMPVTRPGAVYERHFGGGVVALQLPLPATPMALFRIEPEPPPNRESLPPFGVHELLKWLWTPAGHVAASAEFGTRTLWYLPASTVEKYVQSHPSQVNDKYRIFGAPSRLIGTP